MSLMTISLPDDKTVNLNKVYDAVVIGSGAAGGMAAHALTSRGMKVLLLEAGRKVNTTEELKSTEWPYEHPRRGDMPPGNHALSLNEYTIRQPPYAGGIKANHVYSYVQGWGGSDSIFQRPTRLNEAEVHLRGSLAKMGRTLTPYRAGVTTEGVKNKYRKNIRSSFALTALKAAAGRRCFPATQSASRASARVIKNGCAITPERSSRWARSAKCSRVTRTTPRLTRT